MVTMPKRPQKRAPGRPPIHGGDRVSVQLHGEYRDRLDKLVDLLAVKMGHSIVSHRNEAVQWAIDRAITELEAGR